MKRAGTKPESQASHENADGTPENPTAVT